MYDLMIGEGTLCLKRFLSIYRAAFIVWPVNPMSYVCNYLYTAIFLNFINPANVSKAKQS